MARLLQLESFDMSQSDSALGNPPGGDLEDLRLTAYEQGFSAGWDDAIAAQSTEVARLRADLGRNLAAMTLNHHDARRHVLTAIEPLLQDMVAKVLPMAARQSLGPMILEGLTPAAAELSAAPVLVRVAPDNLAVVSQLLAGGCDLPLKVVGDDTLGPGQAYLKVAETEMTIDLDRVIAAMATAVGAFFQVQKQEEQP